MTKGRKRERVVLQLGRPYRSGRNGDWCCGFRIRGLDERTDEPRVIYGADAVQAVYLALQIALNELVWTHAYEEGRLTWNGFYDLGLPVMGAANRRRIKKDPRAERIKKEIDAQFADRNRPRERSRGQGRDTTTGRARR